MYINLPALVFFFILGTAIGSFLNVLIDRLPKGESVRGRSHCDHCKAILRAKDLVPVVSFLTLRGRCRYCKQKISWQYPVVEVATGMIFVISYLYFDSNALIFYLSTLSGLMTIFFTDLKYQIIPDKIVFPLIFWSLLYDLFQPEIIKTLLASFSVSLFFLLLIFVTKGRGMGGGDVKLGFLVGLLSPWPRVLVSLYVAFVLGGLVATILLLLKKKRFGQTLAFGPFLVVGVVSSVFFGDTVLAWYLRKFVM